MFTPSIKWKGLVKGGGREAGWTLHVKKVVSGGKWGWVQTPGWFCLTYLTPQSLGFLICEMQAIITLLIIFLLSIKWDGAYRSLNTVCGTWSVLSECQSDYYWERQAGDQWGEHKGAVGLAKPAEVMERGFSEEGVNEMVQRAPVWAEELECPQGIKRGVDALQPHGWRAGPPFHLVCSGDGAPSGEGWGEGSCVFFLCLAWGYEKTFNVRSQTLAPGDPFLPWTALLCFSRSGWRHALCCSCCRWQQKPDKAHLF